MFVSPGKAGMGEFPFLPNSSPTIASNPEKSWEELLAELRWIKQKSHTWNHERREYIRQHLSAIALIKIHNALIQELMSNTVISPQDKAILLSLEQEWITPEWKHFWLIRKVSWKVKTLQTQWISLHNRNLWQVAQYSGYRKLVSWQLNV